MNDHVLCAKHRVGGCEECDPTPKGPPTNEQPAEWRVLAEKPAEAMALREAPSRKETFRTLKALAVAVQRSGSWILAVRKALPAALDEIARLRRELGYVGTAAAKPKPKMRSCGKCQGEGPCLWDERDSRYLCVKCHSNPEDDFFKREVRALDAIVVTALRPDVQGTPSLTEKEQGDVQRIKKLHADETINRLRAGDLVVLDRFTGASVPGCQEAILHELDARAVAIGRLTNERAEARRLHAVQAEEIRLATDLAMKREAERDEALDLATRWQSAADTCNANAHSADEHRKRAERERAEALARVKALDEAAERSAKIHEIAEKRFAERVKERDEARAERDLAERALDRARAASTLLTQLYNESLSLDLEHDDSRACFVRSLQQRVAKLAGGA